jgi:uncharacterized protein (UPF0332 family)
MKEFLNSLFKQGKLKLVEPSENIFNSYLEKSSSNLESAKILLNVDKLEESVALVYYSMYNLVLALLYKVGIKSENHSGSIILLKEIFNFDNQLIVESKKERIDKQYYVGFEISKKEVEQSLMIAEDFNRDLKGFISGLNNRDIEVYRSKFEELVK